MPLVNITLKYFCYYLLLLGGMQCFEKYSMLVLLMVA